MCIVTGTRAEYGLLVPIMRRVQTSPKLRLQVVATGMHLAAEFGHTVDLIRQDGFPVDAEVDMLFSSDDVPAMAKGVGVGIYGMAQIFEILDPDIVLVLGDRVEAFAAATAASLSGRIVGHIHGGERTAGGLDEYMRHAVTKLAHLHFTATEASRERVLRLGERPEYVWTVGAPGLDDLESSASLGRKDLTDYLGFPLPDPYVLLVHHPISTFPERAVEELRTVLAALDRVGLPVVALGPNSDAGGRALAEELRRWSLTDAHHLLVSLPRNVFLSLMRHAASLVGNTSSGIIEGASLRVPYVLVGDRQHGRERTSNVLETACEVSAIERALRRAVGDPAFRESLNHLRNPYGDGHAAERIVETLERVPLGPELRRKVITY
ncbi:UDP-N-acetylglucosamine 2-epimerase [Limnochorda pilosa]|uniref:UDP-N-acetylglucosamine 2-epimerase n=1 Tax=Limnochorda pilosa TaxID=1555112 RepID=A0A0K2SM74_LIMPI|nr:UDP-N-acetylglucosamine 2-epimerase [Limnochorda pilosa]